MASLEAHGRHIDARFTVFVLPFPSLPSSGNLPTRMDSMEMSEVASQSAEGPSTHDEGTSEHRKSYTT